MKKAYINAVSYFTPKKSFSNKDLVEEFPEWSVEKVASKIGIDNRFIADENLSTSDLAVNASEKLFKEHNIDRKIINFIL